MLNKEGLKAAAIKMGPHTQYGKFYQAEEIAEKVIRAYLDAAGGEVVAASEIRNLALKQPVSGNRNTYADGFAQGLWQALDILLAPRAPEASYETQNVEGKPLVTDAAVDRALIAYMSRLGYEYCHADLQHTISQDEADAMRAALTAALSQPEDDK